MSEEEKETIDCVKSRIYGNENLEKITVYMEEINIILNLITKQQNKIDDVKVRLEYYLMGNLRFNDEAQKEFKKLFKMLEEKNEHV